MWGLDEVTVETILFATAYTLALMITVQISWLVVRRSTERAKKRRLERLDREFSNALLDVLDSGDAKHAAHVLRDVPRRDLRDWLTAIAARTSGDYLLRIRKLYEALGLTDADVARFRRGQRLAQLVTARRLVLMGPSALLKGSSRVSLSSHGARLLLLMAFGPDDDVPVLLAQLRDWPPVDELQSQPLRIVLRSLRPPQHEALMAHWSEIEEPTVQALVLREACLQLPERQAPWLRTAFTSTHPILRKTACDICREMGRVDQAVRVVAAAEDPEPTVRIAAVQCLGALRLESARDPLIHALQDTHHEVQVAAAYALFRLGGSSREQLQWSRRLHPDPQCRDIAAMVLDELDEEAA